MTQLELFAFVVLPLSIVVAGGAVTYLYLWRLRRLERRSGK